MKNKTIINIMILGLVLIGIYSAGSFLSVVGVRQVPGEVHIGDTLRHKFALFCDDQQGCFGVRATTSLVKPAGGTASTVGLNKDAIYSSDGIGFSGTSDSFDTMLPYTHILTLYAKDFTLLDTYPTGDYTLDTTVEYKDAAGSWKSAFHLAEAVTVLAKPTPTASPPATNQPSTSSQPPQVVSSPVTIQQTSAAVVVSPTPSCIVSSRAASEWSSCSGGLQARVVSDDCGGRLQESQECFSFPSIRWDYVIVVMVPVFLMVVFAFSGKKKRRRGY